MYTHHTAGAARLVIGGGGDVFFLDPFAQRYALDAPRSYYKTRVRQKPFFRTYVHTFSYVNELVIE
jgi:hypothetical protein